MKKNSFASNNLASSSANRLNDFSNKSPNGEQNYQNEEVQIELDYEELLKNRTIKDKKSNILIRLAPDDPMTKKKPKHKKTKKPPKTSKTLTQIDTKDITDIIIIILLILILGVSLFRVVMQVQIQFQKAQQFLPHGSTDPNAHSQHPTHTSQTASKQPTIPKQPQITITLSEQCQKHIDNILVQHGHLYEFKYPDKQMKLKSKIEHYQQAKSTYINKQKYLEAVTLLRVIHKITPDGTLVISPDPCQSQNDKKQRLEKTLNQQFNRWNSDYQMDSHHSKQLPFCIVVNSFNNAKSGLIYRNLDSILQQNYTNYHLVYTDDASTDQTGQKVTQYLKLKNFQQNKLHLTINQQKKGMMENIYNAIHNHCKNGQIVVMLDGDDSFVGVNVLSLLNAGYQNHQVAILWTNFISIFNNNQVSIGFSHDYTQKQKSDAIFRKMKGFISSHLKTFFVDLFKMIRVEDLQYNNGRFFGGASDTAMMIPMLEMANPKFKYIPEVTYEYRYDTGQTGNIVNKGPQKQALTKIFTTKEYAKLQNFDFIGKAIESAMVITPIEKAVESNVVESEESERISLKQKAPEFQDSIHKEGK